MRANQVGRHTDAQHTPGQDGWEGKVVLVAGATRGLGHAVASRLAAEGATVMILPRTPEQAAGMGQSSPSRVFRLFPTDLSKPAGVLRAIAHILDLGGVDVLINVAAPLDPIHRCTDTEAATLERVFQFNVVVPADLSVLLLPQMVERGWGRIVNVSAGLAGEQTSAISEAYVASRHALEAHTRNLAARLSGTGVTANVYRPGAVGGPGPQVVERRRRTEGMSLHQRFVSYAPNGRVPPAQEVMPLLRLLGSDQTGNIWAADDWPR